MLFHSILISNSDELEIFSKDHPLCNSSKSITLNLRVLIWWASEEKMHRPHYTKTSHFNVHMLSLIRVLKNFSGVTHLIIDPSQTRLTFNFLWEISEGSTIQKLPQAGKFFMVCVSEDISIPKRSILVQ